MTRETKARISAAKKNIHKRARAAQKRAQGQDKAPLYWIWEFSKKVVIITAVLYFISFIFAMITSYSAMIMVADTTALSTLIAEANETFRVVVGGYMIKAGVENAAKIITANTQKREQQDEPQEGIGGLVPDDIDDK